MESFIAEPLIMVLGLLAAVGLGAVMGFIARGRYEGRRRSGRREDRAVAAPGPEPPRPSTRRVTALPPAPASTSWDRPAGAPADIGLDDGDGPLVLLVDDRMELLALHGSYLHEHGYRVLTAQDGETGLDYARTHDPSVIVLDHSMPRRTGLDVARELKADPATADIPILLMTAHSYGAVGAAAKEAGCDTFLSKPVAPSRMLREVTLHVERGAGRP